MRLRHVSMMIATAMLALAFAAPVGAAPLADTSYTIVSGDTLSAIGARCGVNWQQIASKNNIANPSRISVGTKLTIPGSDGCKAAAPAPAAQPAAGGQPQPQAPAAAASSAGFGYGIQVHAPGGDQRSIDAVKDIGFNWVKQQVEWHRHEGSQGQYDFGGLDNLVNQAIASGINVMFSVVKAPGWARPGNTDHSVEGPPADPNTFANFLGAMAAHFRGRVAAYEVWNEQNLHYEWGNEAHRRGALRPHVVLLISSDQGQRSRRYRGQRRAHANRREQPPGDG